ncbi:MAG TPA: DUF4389 domain-containing protein, partial [Hyphomicrobiales bacterium]|nr:DUF4389 domain-containing protein [Hyphomicrobiales bacterium]
DQIKQNLLSPAAWVRILFMAGFAVAIWLTLLVLGVVVLMQALLVLITGLPNANLQRFGLVAGAYLFELVQFLLYNTDDKPFPFAPFPDPPDGDDDDDDDDDDDWKNGHGGGVSGMRPSVPPAPPSAPTPPPPPVPPMSTPPPVPPEEPGIAEPPPQDRPLP